MPQPSGVITAAAPDRCNSLSESDTQQLLAEGYLESPSSRTGQMLRIGRDFLQEQLDEPQQHDVLAMAARTSCPMLIVHGERDATVPVEAASRIAQASSAGAMKQIIAGADHVFNTPNPLPADSPASTQLATLLELTIAFANDALSKTLLD